MRRNPAGAAGFLKADRGVSAVEFALVAPVLLFVTLAGAQVVQYINAMRKVEAIATSIGSMISQATPPTASTTIASVRALDLNFSYDASLVIFPYVLYDAKQKNVTWRSDLTVSYASVLFTKLNDSCSGMADLSGCYAATVLWTSSGTSSNQFRPCGLPQVAVDDNAIRNRLTLPRSVYGPGTLIVIDVTFTFVPTFGSALVGPVTITRSAYMQPRYATQINFNPTGTDGIATTCT